MLVDQTPNFFVTVSPSPPLAPTEPTTRASLDSARGAIHPVAAMSMWMQLRRPAFWTAWLLTVSHAWLLLRTVLSAASLSGPELVSGELLDFMGHHGPTGHPPNLALLACATSLGAFPAAFGITAVASWREPLAVRVAAAAFIAPPLSLGYGFTFLVLLQIGQVRDVAPLFALPFAVAVFLVRVVMLLPRETIVILCSFCAFSALHVAGCAYMERTVPPKTPPQ
jgi:hypothetical protein